MEFVEHLGCRYALILRRPAPEKNVEFHTPDDAQLQVGSFNLPSGYEIQPHIHLPFERRLTRTAEVLVIQSGKLQVDFYDTEQKFICTRTIEGGDVIVLFEGGHGFKVLENVRMLEIKQGPFAGGGDKARFSAGGLSSATE